MKWTPIAEPPEKSGRYLVFAPSADKECPLMTMVHYDVERGWALVPLVWMDAVTHWALPPPPD